MTTRKVTAAKQQSVLAEVAAAGSVPTGYAVDFYAPEGQKVTFADADDTAEEEASATPAATKTTTATPPVDANADNAATLGDTTGSGSTAGAPVQA